MRWFGRGLLISLSSIVFSLPLSLSASTIDSVFTYTHEHAKEISAPPGEFQVWGCSVFVADPARHSELAHWAERLDRFFFPLSQRFGAEVSLGMNQIYEARGPRVTWMNSGILALVTPRLQRESLPYQTKGPHSTVAINPYLQRSLVIRRVELMVAALAYGLLQVHPEFSTEAEMNQSAAYFDLVAMLVRQQVIREIPAEIWNGDAVAFIPSEGAQQLLRSEWKLNRILPAESLVRLTISGRHYRLSEDAISRLVQLNSIR